MAVFLGYNQANWEGKPDQPRKKATFELFLDPTSKLSPNLESM